MGLTENSKGIGFLWARVGTKVKFEILCAKCRHPLIIATILHFADCPQVRVEPCSCSCSWSEKPATIVVEDMKKFVEYLEED